MQINLCYNYREMSKFRVVIPNLIGNPEKEGKV